MIDVQGLIHPTPQDALAAEAIYNARIAGCHFGANGNGPGLIVKSGSVRPAPDIATAVKAGAAYVEGLLRAMEQVDDADQRVAVARIVHETGEAQEGDGLSIPETDQEVAASNILAMLGGAGSGKTHTLTSIRDALRNEGWEPMDFTAEEPEVTSKSYILAATTNAAARVASRKIGEPVVTVHKAIYVPRHTPLHACLGPWLVNGAEKYHPGAQEADILDAMMTECQDPIADATKAGVFDQDKVVPAIIQLSATAKNGKDIERAIGALEIDTFPHLIDGFILRDDEMKVPLIVVDEASMANVDMLKDLVIASKMLVLVGDPLQLPPVTTPRDRENGVDGRQAFSIVPPEKKIYLQKIRRQAEGSSIIDLAYMALSPTVTIDQFMATIDGLAVNSDPSVLLRSQFDPRIMAASPALCWTNATRLSLITGWRQAFGLPGETLQRWEPLICQNNKIIDGAGKVNREPYTFVKGQAFFVNHTIGTNFLNVWDGDMRELEVEASVADDRQAMEKAGVYLPTFLRGWSGVRFRHGAASTIHTAQGNQWETVQISMGDLYKAAHANKPSEPGDNVPQWKRLAYVALTRAEKQAIFVTANAVGGA